MMFVPMLCVHEVCSCLCHCVLFMWFVVHACVHDSLVMLVCLMLVCSCSWFTVCICSVGGFLFVGFVPCFCLLSRWFVSGFLFSFVWYACNLVVFLLLDVFPCDFDSVVSMLLACRSCYLLVIMLLTCVHLASIGFLHLQFSGFVFFDCSYYYPSFLCTFFLQISFAPSYVHSHTGIGQ